MENLPVYLMDLGGLFASYVSETPILLIFGIGLATAIWRYGGRPSRQD